MRHLIQSIRTNWVHLTLLVAANIFLFYLLERVKGGVIVMLFANLAFLKRNLHPVSRIALATLLTLICIHSLVIWYTRKWVDLLEAILLIFPVLMLVVCYLSPILKFEQDESAKN